MPYQMPLEALFLTNFSDACFHASRAVAQLADDLQLRLSILHVYDPRQEDRRAAEEKLHSFFPEADRFRGCRRIIDEGEVVDAVSRLQLDRRVDLVIAPVSDSVRLPRLRHRSIRVRLLAECGLSVFTIDRKADFSKLGSPPRNVACWLDFDAPATHLKLAVDFASTTGARLHLLHALPELYEGSILPPSQPLHRQEVVEAVHSQLGPTAIRPEIHILPRSGAGALLKLVRSCNADLLFVNEAQAINDGLLSSSMSSEVQSVPCPTICVSNRAGVLRPQPGPAHLTALREAAFARAEKLS